MRINQAMNPRTLHRSKSANIYVIDPNSKNIRQSIDGFGGSIAFGEPVQTTKHYMLHLKNLKPPY